MAKLNERRATGRVLPAGRPAIAAATALLVLLAGWRPAQAAPLSLSEVPLVTGGGVPANLLVTFDDSGSMAWAFIPDDRDDTSARRNSRRYKAFGWNPMYYNPYRTYHPPLKADGTPLTTSFNSAYVDGFNPALGTVNLATGYRPTWYLYEGGNCSGWPSTGIWCHDFVRNPAADYPGKETSPVAAYYYIFDSSLSGCSGSLNDDDCYRRVVVSSTSGPGGTDERQNFANWYSFYRTRSLMVRTAASRAFASMGKSVRLGWQNLHSCDGFDTGCRDWRGNTYDSRMRTFTGTHRTNFYDWLFRTPSAGNTPLRRALNRAGQALSGTDPYRDDPLDSGSTARACRQSFHIALTDGLWNGPTPSGIGDYDDTAHTLPDGKSYSPAESSATAHPYHSGYSVNLADIAFYYWARDLASGVPNKVPPYIVETSTDATEQYWNPKNDPASWQHMVNFFVALGLRAFLGSDWGGDTYYGAYFDFKSGARHWPDTGTLSGKVYDLWHAALNSRGQFFSADDPTDLVDALNAILGSIAERTAAASAPSLSSGSIVGGARLYQARFQSGTWTGELLAFNLADGSGSPCAGAAGTICTPAVWNARDQVNLQADAHSTQRRIITFKPSARKGVPFRWPANPSSPGPDEIDTAQAEMLHKDPATGSSDGKGAQRLAYLRGEDVSGFRARTHKLGDIVHSAPVYVGRVPDFPYPDTIESSSYSGFRESIKALNSGSGRRAMVYVGANDGMLHGFDAETGREIFAYVPGAVFGKLNRLTSPSYGHTYYVDGQMTVVDAFVGGSWRTVLVGTLGGGGQGVFALDVTNPDEFLTESGGAAKVLWEFTDADDADLGYTYGAASIVKLQDGRWAAIFGNGYNSTVDNAGDGATGDSTTGNAVLYIVDLADGTLIRKIDTGVGKADDPEALSRPNGLATPAVVDIDGDFVADYVYAGDLFGNLWRFDLTGPSPSAWKVTPTTGGGTPIFKARSPGAPPKAQPITVMPVVTRHPAGLGGVMIYFGTGKYIETGDNTATGQPTQTFYAIWDQPDKNVTVARSDLLQQQILLEVTTTVTAGSSSYTYTTRQTTADPIDWSTQKGWYMDLIVSGAASNKGERVISPAVAFDDRIIFVTIQPDGDPCEFGGTSWLMELALDSGARLDDSPFDLNADGLFTSADFVDFGTVTEAAGGMQIKGIAFGPSFGVTKPPSPGSGGKQKMVKYLQLSGGSIRKVDNRPGAGAIGRQSWIELIR